MKRLVQLVVLGASVMVMPLVSHAAGTKTGKPMADRYLVIVPHTVEQCMSAMEQTAAKGNLAKWDFGCESGDHAGYLITTAKSSEEALAMVPEDLRAGAKAIKVKHYTPADLKKMHEKM